MVDLEKLTARRDEINHLAERYHVRNVRVFGSVARREAKDGVSDVDLLVTTGPECSLFDLGGLLEDLTDMLGCKVDLVPENSLKPDLRNRVLREALPL
jgi:uncharacterized protein